MRIKPVPRNHYRFFLPPSIWSKPGLEPIEWYAELRDGFGGLLHRIGNRQHPARVTVTESKKKKAVSALTKTPGPIEPVAPMPPPPAWYERWWVWALIGGVALAAGGTVAALTLTAEGPEHRTFSVDIH